MDDGLNDMERREKLRVATAGQQKVLLILDDIWCVPGGAHTCPP